jgi:hypothetical protein
MPPNQATLNELIAGFNDIFGLATDKVDHAI